MDDEERLEANVGSAVMPDMDMGPADAPADSSGLLLLWLAVVAAVEAAVAPTAGEADLPTTAGGVGAVGVVRLELNTEDEPDWRP